MGHDGARRSAIVAISTLGVTDANEGTLTVLRCLLPALHRIAPELEQLLICSTSNRHLFPSDATTVDLELAGSGRLRRIWVEQTAVPRLVRGRADVLFSPQGVGTILSPLPEVLFVQAHLALPSCQALAGDGGLSRFHRLYYGAPFRWSMRRAKAVLANSQFTADGLVSELGADPAKTSAMPLGVDLPATTVDPDGPKEPRVLFVGTLYGYKDAVVAVEAFARARVDLPSGARLVVVGKDPDGQQHALLRAAAVRGGVADAVDLVGKVTDAELEAQYRAASLLVLPSRCEGFGLPVLEAMSHGVPVAVADSTALREVAAGAGLLVPPGDAAALAGAMTSALTDRALHRRLAQEGRARAEEMSWDASARRLRDAIRRVLDRR